MLGVVLSGHGQFAPGVASAVQMVAGDQDNFEVVPFTQEDAASYPDRLAETITTLAQSCDEVVVAVDLLGGTPFNQAMMVSAKVPGVQVVTGTNLPMLLEALVTRLGDPNMSADDFVATAIEAGQTGICSKSFGAIEEDQSDDLFDDGI